MGLVEQNPVIATISPEGSKPRERVLSGAELAKIWKACRDDDYGRIFRLSILLGARRQEVGGMGWREIDFDAGTWTLPAERSKNGKDASIAAAADGARDHSERAASGDAGSPVRRSRGSRFQRVAQVQAATRCTSRIWTPHDFRRTLSTRLHDLGVAPHVVEQILNHQSHRGSVAAVYNRSRYEPEVRTALALWEDHIRTLVEGGERKVFALAGQRRPS
jgi:integrase